MSRKKTVVVGICGGIAAYKACDVVSSLKKLGYEVHVIMTKAATEFIKPLTLQTLSQNFVITDMFAEPKTWEVEHISLAKKADLFLIVPGTANFVGKIASGIADDMLTTTIMATRAKVVIALAMNTNMLTNQVVERNIEDLKKMGYGFIEADEGLLACGDVGKGKLATPEKIVEATVFEMEEKDLNGKNILVTAGPTVEPIDPVRYMSNRSSGKMGYSIAERAAKRGAKVTLVSGKTSLKVPYGVFKVVDVLSADDMYNAVMENLESNDIIIQSAAVADYKPKTYSNKKIKKKDEDLSIELGRNKDIALEVGKKKGDRVLIGFAAESNDLIENAKRKIDKKNLDFIIANDITAKGAGFANDTNIIKLIDKDANITEYPILSKKDVADIILDRALSIKRSNKK